MLRSYYGMRFINEELRYSANYIDLHFRENGLEMYNINPDALFCWKSIYDALKKRSLELSKHGKMLSMDDIYEPETKEDLQRHMNTFDSCLNAYLYDIVVHDHDVLDHWKTVKNALEFWLKKD